jgi:hypothetical protein
MTADVDAEPGSIASPATRAVWPWVLLVLLFAAAIVQRHLLAANTDVSWLLTVAEQVLDGRRLYLDVIETNPPMAVLVYIPGIIIAGTLGLPAELVTDTLVFAGIFVSLAFAARILQNSIVLRGVAGWSLALLAFAIVAILPAKIFGQREHIALLELLPWLALTAVRSARGKPAAWAVVVAGIGAGLALSFKPPFAIGVIAGLGALAIQQRSLRMFFHVENIIAGAVVALYSLLVILFYPAFFTEIAPLLRDVYVWVGASPLEILKTPALPIWAIAVFAALMARPRGRIDGALLLLLATSAGFVAVYIMQRKGWPYHSYPMIALAMLGLGFAVVTRTPFDRIRGSVGLGLLAVLFVQSVVWFNWAFDKAFDARPLWDVVARYGPHPKILAITAEPGIGHPMVRALQGTWVSRQQGLWVSFYTQAIRADGALTPDRAAILDADAARERARLIGDIRRTPPDVVLVDNFSGNWSAWLTEHADVASELAGYRVVATINDIEIRAKTPAGSSRAKAPREGIDFLINQPWMRAF